jgi:ribosomal protein S18 acetylase RimI-like enzyme
MMIRYQQGAEAIDSGMLNGFFVGWGRPVTTERHLQILIGSSIAILAIDDQRRQVVGFITAITDGSFAAYIPLLEVLPEYQGQGIGTELVRKVLDQLEGFYMIDVVCDKDVQPFYDRFGMQPWTAMIFRNVHYPEKAEP